MADRSTGPVKPPVIDLTARASARSEGEGKPAADPVSPAAPPRPESSRPSFSLAGANWPLLGGVAVAGAVLGTILTYIVATALPLPTRQPVAPDLTAFVNTQGEQITTLTDQIGKLQTSTAALQDTTKKTQVSLDATIAQLDGGLAAANKSIDELKAAMPAGQPAVDLTPLQAELKTLKAQVDAIAAGASGADASAIAQSLSDVQTGLTSLTTRLNGVDQTVSALRADLDGARKTLTDHINAALPNEVGPAMKLPLILSGLESTLDTGRPVQDELAALASVLPDLAIPETLKAASAAGLTRPDALLQKFEATLPDIMAARGTGSGDWVQNSLDWAKSLLALRPAEEQQGDSPEAVVSRLEGAMTRHDYAAASTLLAQLPAPMQQAAAPVAADIAAHAAADRLVTDLRARALSAAEAKS
jgi:hypothetical protein